MVLKKPNLSTYLKWVALLAWYFFSRHDSGEDSCDTHQTKNYNIFFPFQNEQHILLLVFYVLLFFSFVCLSVSVSQGYVGTCYINTVAIYLKGFLKAKIEKGNYIDVVGGGD